MDEFKNSLEDLKKQLSAFINDYYKELIKIWKSISVLETKQKIVGLLYGSISGLIVSILTALVIYFIKT